VANAGDQNGDGTDDLLIPGLQAVNLVSGANGQLLASITEQSGGTWFGASCESLADLDGDGVREFTVADWDWRTAGTTKGRVTVFRGRTHSVVGHIVGPANDPLREVSQLGVAFASMGDVDQDSVPDFALSGHLTVLGNSQSFVWVISGRTLGRVYAIPLLSSPHTHDLAPIADLDADGIGDLLVLDARGTTPPVLRGFSARTRSEIFRITPPPSHAFGSVTALSDVDGDSIADFAVGLLGEWCSFLVPASSLRVYSGRSRQLIYEVNSCEPVFRSGISIGLSMTRSPDLDGDGVDEILYPFPMALSGRTGQFLWFDWSTTISAGGPRASWLRDTNRDGYDDFAISRGGWVYLYSGKPVATSQPFPGGCPILPALLVTDDPRLGTAASITVSRAAPLQPGVLLLSLVPRQLVPVGTCTAALDPQSIVTLMVFLSSVSGSWRASVTVPNSAWFAGVNCVLQALVINNQTLDWSNPIQWTLGF
jgi:hypothetical protein